MWIWLVDGELTRGSDGVRQFDIDGEGRVATEIPRVVLAAVVQEGPGGLLVRESQGGCAGDGDTQTPGKQ